MGYRVSSLLEGAPPTLVHEPSGLAAWVTEPLGFVTELASTTHLDAAMARFITGPVHDAVYAARAEEKLLSIHAWSSMSGYDSEARAILTKWATANRGDIARLAVVLPPQRAIVRMGVQVAATSLRLVGLSVDLSDSITSLVVEHGLRSRSR